VISEHGIYMYIKKVCLGPVTLNIEHVEFPIVESATIDVRHRTRVTGHVHVTFIHGISLQVHFKENTWALMFTI